MSDHRPDPFEALAQPIESQELRPSFRRSLRTRLAADLGLVDDIPTIDLPGRTTMSSTDSPTRPSDTPSLVATVVTPYLAVANGAAAIEWYTTAFGAVEQFRVADDQGRIGHAELTIGSARVMLSDEYAEMNVVGPATLGNTTVALHLEVADVDALFARSVEAGATALREPEDQPHGARHGTILDPFGHRWMLSQTLEELSIDEYAGRAQGSGFTVERPAAANGGIWSALFYADATAGIRFLVDQLGFEEQLVVPGPDDTVVHSQLRWPEGGIVQAGTYDPDNPYSRPPGSGSLYLVTADPQGMWDRCRAAGLEVVAGPRTPEYDPDGMVFSVRDPEGNVFSIGSYAGDA
ncbi:MAG: VOC family protein [Acidimicrobiales bacterium]